MRGCRCTGVRLCDQCQRLAERAGVLAPPEVPAVSEKAFQAAVIRLAKAHGWLCYHTHDSRKSLPGYPDLTLCHPSGQRPVLFAELKVPGGQLTRPQEAWLEALALAQGKEVHLWQPKQWPLVVQALSR